MKFHECTFPAREYAQLFDFKIIYGSPLYRSRYLFILECWRVCARISEQDSKTGAI
jgi:hypothetical protein